MVNLRKPVFNSLEDNETEHHLFSAENLYPDVVLDEQGSAVPVLYTRAEVLRARRRAVKNKRDAPTVRWHHHLRAWFARTFGERNGSIKENTSE